MGRLFELSALGKWRTAFEAKTSRDEGIRLQGRRLLHAIYGLGKFPVNGTIVINVFCRLFLRRAVVTLTGISLDPSPSQLAFLVSRVRIVTASIVVTVGGGRYARRSRGQGVFVLRVCVVRYRYLSGYRIAVLSGRHSRFLSRGLFIRFFTTTFQRGFVGLVGRFSNYRFVRVQEGVSSVVLRYLRRLRQSTVTRSFGPVLAGVFLVSGFLDFIKVSRRYRSSAVRRFHRVEGPSVNVVAPINGRNRSGAYSLKSARFVEGGAGVQFYFLVGLFSREEPFYLFCSGFGNLRRICQLRVFLV